MDNVKLQAVKDKSQGHGSETFLYSFSKMLERASYYGLRGLIVLYMVGETLNLPSDEALKIYGWFTALLIYSNILGALLGDLVIGNRKAIILGGVFQALGAIILCFPTMTSLYVGIAFVILGGGLYSSNLTSNFCKLYLNKIKLLDAGIIILYLAINIGAFFSALTIGLVGDKLGYNIGFLLSGLLMLLSLVPIFLVKKVDTETTNTYKTATNKNISKTILAIIFVGLFWTIYEFYGERTYSIQSNLSVSSISVYSKMLWQSVNVIFIIPIFTLAIILWTKYYSSSFFKLAVGFIFASLSFVILYLMPVTTAEVNAIYYILAIALISFAEVFISPVVYGMLTKYTNPKYLAIFISLAFLPSKFFIYTSGFFRGGADSNSSIELMIGVIIISIIGVGLVIYNILNKEKVTI